MKIAILIAMTITVIECLIIFVFQRNYIKLLEKENEELTKRNIREKKLSDGYKELAQGYEELVSNYEKEIDEIL